MKIKQFGKNQRVFKKLVADTETEIILRGHEAKNIFENLIGFDFITKIIKDGLEVTGPDGESFFIKTNISFNY